MPRQSKEFKALVREKKQSQHRQKSLEELAQKLKKSGLEEMASEMLIEPPGAEKMSEVLRKFMAPYMSTVNHTHEYRSLLELAVVAWNASLFPKAKQQEVIDQLFGEEVFKGDTEIQKEVKGIIAELIDRKNKYFANIKRFVVEFNLKDTGEDYHLSVASTEFKMKSEDMADNE
jgi:hypothetical protein